MTVITLDRPQIGRNNDESFVSQTKVTSNYPNLKKRKKFLMFGLKHGCSLK